MMGGLVHQALAFGATPSRFSTASGEAIPLDQLRYWSVERQEAYASPVTAQRTKLPGRITLRLLSRYSTTASPPPRSNRFSTGMRGRKAPLLLGGDLVPENLS